MKHIRHIISKIVLVIAAVFNVAAATAMNPDDMVYEQVSRYVGEPDVGIITDDICDAAYTYNVDPVLVAAVFTAESHFDQSAVSPAGAIGIAQLMPDTADSLGVNPYNLHDNIYGGVAYLGQMLYRYQNWDDPYVYAEAAYNAGPGAVDAAGGIPNIAETQNYVDTVEQIRWDIWNSFGGGNYDMEYTDNDSEGNAEQPTADVNVLEAKKQVSTAKNVLHEEPTESADTLRIWPPVTTKHK